MIPDPKLPVAFFAPTIIIAVTQLSHMTATTSESDTQSREQAACEKCASLIPVEADRCPECGHEPGLGTAGGALLWVVFSAGCLFTAIALASLVVVFNGDTTTGVFGLGVFGLLAAGCFGLVYLAVQNSKHGPTGSE